MAAPRDRNELARILDLPRTAPRPKGGKVLPVARPSGHREIAAALGVSRPGEAKAFEFQPSPETFRYAEQKYIKDNTPWYLDAITTGPVGGFLNAIQKPLAFTTSALKEGIDVFTGEDASWGDFKKQYDDNYTFGRLLHDYDILQNRDSGWQRFGAAALGFIGDVALDPLSYLGLVGKGIGFGSVLARNGAKQAARELVRKSVLSQLRTKGDDIMGAVGKNMRRGQWEALSDDLAQSVAAGGKKGLRDLGEDGWEWSAKVSGLPEQTIRFTNDEVANLERFMDIGGRAVDKGATAVSGDDLRFAAKMFADSGLDRNLRHGADEFVDEFGKGLREQVAEAGLDESVDQTISQFYKRGGRTVVDADAYKARMRSGNTYASPSQRRNIGWFSAEDAANMRLQFGLKVPFTGPIGRKLKIAPKIEKIIRKTGASGAQIPIGLRFITSETPIIGKLVTGIPQGVRNGILRQAAQAAGAKNIPDALRRGGLFRLAGKITPEGWTLSGRMGDLKNAIRNSTDGVFIQQGKRVVHALARGRNVGRLAKVEMSQLAASFMDDVKAARSANKEVTNELVYSAMGGNKTSQDILETMAPGLHKRGMDTMENMRTIANNKSGRLEGFLGKADNYVPRQLTDEAHEILSKKMRETGKFSDRVHGRRMGEPGGPELKRKYVSKEQFDREVADMVADEGISVEEAARRVGEDRSTVFFGREIVEPGTKTGIVDPTTGKEMVAGSVEDQIAEAIEAAGGNYQLFTNDIEMALKGYIDQVSHRVGEVDSESMLFNEGVLVDRMAEYVRLPTPEAVELGVKVRAAQEAYVKAQGDVIEALNREAADLVDPAVNAKRVKKLEEIAGQKEAELRLLDDRQAQLLVEYEATQSAYAANRLEFKELSVQMEALEQQIAGTPVGPKLVALEKERIRLTNAAVNLASDAPTLKFAYETLSSGTVQLMHLERAVGRIFGTGDAFDAFVADDVLRGLRTDDLNASLLELEQAGTLPDSVIPMEGPDGARAYLYQTAEGKTIEMERLFMELDGVLQQSDETGIGVWLGVERDLDVMRGADNEATKVDFAMNRIRTEIDEMTQVVEEYGALAPDVLAPDGGAPVPTPEAVMAAQAEILEVTDRYRGPLQADDLQQAIVDSPELRTALSTYYSGSSRPVSAFIDGGDDLEGILSQVSDTLQGSMDNVNTNLEIVTQAAEANGVPVRLRIVNKAGNEQWMTVADYVQLENAYKQTKQFQATMQSPADVVRPSIDDILSGTVIQEQLGTNPGGRFEFDGEQFYVKQYGDMTAGGQQMPPGTGRDRITSEVLANAIYRELGLPVPTSYASRHSNGTLWHVAPWIDDVQTVAQAGLDPRTAVITRDTDGFFRMLPAEAVTAGLVPQYYSSVASELTRGIAADILLANWDVVGTGFDNIGVSATEGLVRIDQGSTFFYRAQGSAKADVPGGWLPEAMSDVERVGGMLDPAMNEWYAPLANAGVAEDTFDAIMANQVRELLDMRLKAGGMENFVRRMMPTPLEAHDDLAKFVDFLEVRLEALANRYSQDFIPAGSDDMMKAALSTRGFSEQAIEGAIESGTAMRLFHATAADPPLELSRRFGYADPGWGDKPFLNLTPGNMYYDSGDYGYNILLDLPSGPKGIKVYGLAAGADEVRAAEIALQMSRAQSVDEVESLVTEMVQLNNSGTGGTAIGHIVLDQVSRVAEGDPKFFRQFVRLLDSASQREAAEQFAGGMSVKLLKAADDLRHYRVPTDVASWGLDNAPRSVLTGKLAASSFEDRLKFVLWAQENTDSIPQELGDQYAMYMMGVDPHLNPTSWADGVAKENRRLTNFGYEFDGLLHSSELGWPGRGGKGALPTQATFKFEAALDPASTVGRRADDMSVGRWYLSQFFHKYQNSLSADGYQAAMWMNVEGAQIVGGGRSMVMPNFMATNPLALRSADVAMTHRNISRLAEAPWGTTLGPEDARLADSELLPPKDPFEIVGADPDFPDIPITAMDQWETDIAALGEVKTLDEISDELFAGWPPPPEHPFWADMEDALQVGETLEDLNLTEADFHEWFDDAVNEGTGSSIFDPNIGAAATPQARAAAQALKGETKYIEPATFMDWWQESTMGPFDFTESGVPDPDILQTLAERRALISMDVATSKQMFDDAATALDEAQALRRATERARREAVDEAADLDFATQEWLSGSAIQERRAKMEAALDVMERIGAPASVPLEDLPDELVALRQAVGALIENDSATVQFAMDQFEEGATDWVELVSQLPEGTRDIHKIAQREDILEDVFRSGMKPFGQLQGNDTFIESMLASERYVARGGASGFFKKYDKLHNLLRAYMIAKPGFHGRNFFSAVFMNHLSGMNWSSYRKFMRAYWKYQEEQATAMGLTRRAAQMRKAMRGRLIDPDNVNPEHVAYIRTLAESGSLGSGHGQVATEFVEAEGRGWLAGKLAGAAPEIKIGRKRINVIDAMNPMNTRNAPLRLSRQFGMATETFVRGSLGFDTMLKGGNASDAFDNIMKFHFDYEDLSDFERNVVKRVVPFYTWTRKNLPLMMEQFARRPEVFNRYLSLKKEIELQTDGPPDVIPKWMIRQGAIQLPFKYDGEDMFVLPDLPFKAPLELIDPAMGWDTSKGWREQKGIMDRVEIALGSLGTQITPLIKAPYEWKAKQNLWKGYNFDGRYEVVPGAYTLIPGLMPMLQVAGAAGKTAEGEWAMRDYTLHAMAQLLPTFTDYRRLFPDETRYQERSLSNWISWLTGTGLRTNTKYEQEMEMIRRQYEMRDELQQERSLRGATLR